MGPSLREYAGVLGHWLWAFIVPIVLDVIGTYQMVVASSDSRIPGEPWMWFNAAFLLCLVIPFVAFHRIRQRLSAVSDARSRELARMVYRVRDHAASLVLRAKVDKAAVQADYEKYNEAVQDLTREAEIDGLRDIVSEHLSTFVGFHVSRFIGGAKVYGGSDLSNIELDEYQFVGRLADRADATVREIRRALQ